MILNSPEQCPRGKIAKFHPDPARTVSTPYSARLSVFLVEDSAPIRDRLAECVMENDFGRIVGYADTEDEAVAAILKLKPDAVLLDIQLRVGNGLNVLKKLHALLNEAMPAVIVFTDFALTDFGRHSTRYGAKYFIDKANGLKHLASLLRTLAVR
jgi:DNA-binding NarL/FixJ family response regulator